MSNSESTPTHQRSLSTILPFLLTLARRATDGGSHSHLSQIVILDHSARTVVVFEGQILDSLLHELSEKAGPLPASKASIEAMPSLEVTELGLDCAVCLEGFQVGEGVKEMPCKHFYHCHCIEKWLGSRGTCPICRFSMPVEEEEEEWKGNEDLDFDRRDGRVVVVNLWVSGDADADQMDVEMDLGHGFGDSDADSESELEDGISGVVQDMSS